ncbi:MAG: hypothetical protein OEM77_05515 [Nitrosopumilus sp.]|nr:hypothetical protein [Nitrosopumilus sp.]MDH3735393.1 hypothetical protein [Nitrosopumilus sp.]MDH3822245.1 hypothetical protein [Nitrosopumilus sp.]MDH3832573.1 hypothetical protein [Nitrosopumilus sp.]
MQTEDEKTIRYKKRRFLPLAEKMQIQYMVNVIAKDRLDNISAKTISDPEHYWRICDANNAMHPEELVLTPGRMLKIATLWN